MECPKCQSEVLDGMKFCGECGSKLESVCPTCGFANPPQYKFCGECGHDLAKHAKPPIDYSEPASYTPGFLADKILTSRGGIEGERKLVTILFADVADFTAMSEKLDPEEVHQIMDGTFKILMDEIHRFEGTVNQFTGDGVMAIFGAPVAHEEHAQRACHASLAIQKEMVTYGEKIKNEFGSEFKMRIGLNSGHVIVGSIGDDLRMDYTAQGDTVNLAARMESLAGPGLVFVSAHTHRLAADFFEFGSLGKLEVKGKAEKQEAWELIKAGEVETRIGASVARGLTRFVGRKEPMAVLNDSYEKVKSGAGQVIGIVGEAGVGKSRLLLEFIGRLPHDQFTLLQGQCLHFGGSMAYLPLLDIIRSYYGIKEGDREVQLKNKIRDNTLSLDDNLKTVIPPFCELLSVKTEDEEYSQLDPKIKKEKTFEALRDLFIRESQNRPLVLIIEDLHWMDNTSQEFLDYLIGRLAGTHILMLLLYRPEYIHHWGSKSFYSKIGLDQLNPNSAVELVDAMLKEGEVAPELKDLILCRAAGNPLFMEEVTHSLLENGTIEKQDQKYVIKGSLFDIQVPDTVQGIIAARMDRLEENLKRTMQVASVVGRDFTFRILHTITDMHEELKSSLLNLQGLEFIYEKQLFPELEYIFKHALIQEVAYNSLLMARRKEIHGRIGQGIEELYPERLHEYYEMLAYHYSKTENYEKALQYMLLSAEKADKKYAHTEVLDICKQTLGIIERQPETDETKRAKIFTYFTMFNPYLNLGFTDGSLKIFQEGKKLAQDLGDEQSITGFSNNISLYYTMTGVPSQGVEHANKSFLEALDSGAADSIAYAANILSMAYFGLGEYLKAGETIKITLELLEKTNKWPEGVTAHYIDMCGRYGVILSLFGNFQEAKCYCEKGLQTAIRDNHQFGKSMAELHYGGFLVLKGYGKLAEDHYLKSIKYSEERKDKRLLAETWRVLGWASHLLGDPKRAVELIKKSAEKRSNEKDPISILFDNSLLSTFYLDEGDLSNTLLHAEKALEVKADSSVFKSKAKIVFGRALLKKDISQFDKAEEYILSGIKTLEELKCKSQYAIGYNELGDFYTDAGRKDGALKYLQKAEVLFQEMEMNYYLGRMNETLHRLHKNEGDLQKAQEHLHKAIGFMKECDADGWVERYEKELAERH
ncbi:MAG: AAA family ATPase [Deltaproteobacteria bacterium]|nr:AAA family ATPase [Deltaproteobacteria bacterium]MBT4643375.1 AAA family ATPase [Deltaproteobacteria bacterium]MBT6501522.1 AAA family ATPase [Deltaproteobacteria bacterium]